MYVLMFWVFEEGIDYVVKKPVYASTDKAFLKEKCEDESWLLAENPAEEVLLEISESTHYRIIYLECL